MRILNNTSESVAINDLHRGNATGESEGIYQGWTAKSSSVVPANGYIDILDTEDAMLSYELGSMKKYIDAGILHTTQSITGKNVGPFTIVSGTNDTFIVEFNGGGDQTFTLPAGDLTIGDVVQSIMASASGFTAEDGQMFRSSNQDNTLPGEVDGSQGNGMGQRTEGILDGFLVLVGDGKIEIKNGTANEVLGFNSGDFTKVG